MHKRVRQTHALMLLLLLLLLIRALLLVPLLLLLLALLRVQKARVARMITSDCPRGVTGVQTKRGDNTLIAPAVALRAVSCPSGVAANGDHAGICPLREASILELAQDHRQA